MFRELRRAITDAAVRVWPEPVCALVCGGAGGNELVLVDGVEDPSRDTFRVDRARLRGSCPPGRELRGFVVSHPCDSARDYDPVLGTPSAAEMRAQLDLALPFGIWLTDGERWLDSFWFGDQCPRLPFVGRPFRHGVFDCYSIVRDYFRQEVGYRIPEFPRDWNWWVRGLDLYADGYRPAGFEPIPDDAPRPHDIALFRMLSKVQNHAGILIEPGSMLHHPGSFRPVDPLRMSHIVPLERWERHVVRWVRLREEVRREAAANRSNTTPGS